MATYLKTSERHIVNNNQV